ncbi:MAG: nucleotide exchange factor GrpE [Alphaproteobacteria bacterium]|nr:MAG: nucleotide exchange factor GrpE [Alphaproteobacteria bacterium]
MSDNQKNQTEKPESANEQAERPEARPEVDTTEADPQTGAQDTGEGPEDQADPRDAEIADLKDRLLRTVAEMENLRKRTERERREATQYAITAFARDLLDVADNLRRALESIPADPASAASDLKPFIEGVEMTERTLLKVFEKHGIERFSPEGEKFDHNFHEAMFEAPTTEHQSGTIIQVVQPGYTIKDRLLRPARVGVARNTQPEADAPHVDKTV